MWFRPVISVARGTPLADAIRLMQDQKIGALLVTDGTRIAGILTERDVLMKVAGRNLDLRTTQIDELMTRDPETLRMEHPIAVALNKMSVGGFRRIALVDREGAPVGIVTIRDIMDYIIGLFPAAVLNMPPDPECVAETRDNG